MLTYQKAGVSVEQGDKFVQKIKKTVQSTHPKTLRTDFGGFAAISNLPTGFKSPKLVTATDGVGTKLFVAGKCETYHTIGVDLVAMCVNDIVTTGAMPWLFLDYFATSSLDSMQGSKLIQGIARGCREAGCALVGGETAEMPGLYRKGDFDLAGFCVGIVESGEEITGQRVQEGDIVWGLPSSGAHSNGYSLIRANGL
ncbi:MAG: phosphoribosylformylglycinamidine cyclo-ligase [Bdellovibrionales bacterium]|nr:phosphoribosylformylglycinamidine cyclo-ligase [Bdellovibrionales bacterium]